MSEVNFRDIEQELYRRKREDPLKYVYQPNERQMEIHRSRTPITVVLGGNRTGKTYGAVAEALYYATGQSPWAEIPDAPNTIWYVMPSLGTLERAIDPILSQLVGEHDIVRSRERPPCRTFANGSTIWFMSADMRQRRAAGAAVDLVIIDEPISRGFFEELQARTISTRGRILMVLTPVDDEKRAAEWLWIRDELYVPWQTGERKDISVIHMPVSDGEGHSLVPHLTDEDIKRIELQYPDPKVRAARMYGEFVVRTGLVFGQFDPDIHLIKRFVPPSNWHQWLVIDPQYHRFACLFFVADDYGNYYITDEYFSQDESLSVRADHIGRILGDIDREIPAYVDYANPQDIVELNYHFRRKGIKVGAMPLQNVKRIEKMLLRTHSMLEPSADRPYHPMTPRKGIYGAPRLLFFDDLMSVWKRNQEVMHTSRLVWEITRMTWDLRGKPDKNSAAGGDCSDCLIYGCSVIASGVAAYDTSSWRDNLSERDIALWESMEAMDKMKRYEGWIR